MNSIVVDRLRDVFGDKPAYERLSASELEIAHACMTTHRARSEVESAMDAADLDRADIIAWLKNLPIGWDDSVVVFWRSFRCGVRMAVKDLALHFDDLWYPASDDVWVSSDAHDWLLDLGHEEAFVFRGEDRTPGDIDLPESADGPRPRDATEIAELSLAKRRRHDSGSAADFAD